MFALAQIQFLIAFPIQKQVSLIILNLGFSFRFPTYLYLLDQFPYVLQVPFALNSALNSLINFLRCTFYMSIIWYFPHIVKRILISVSSIQAVRLRFLLRLSWFYSPFFDCNEIAPENWVLWMCVGYI